MRTRRAAGGRLPVRLAALLMGAAAGVAACAADAENLLEAIRLPDGFHISLYARVPGARSMAVAPDLGAVFVGTLGESVYAIVDEDRDGRAERAVRVRGGFTVANGVAWHGGYLYVADRRRVVRFRAPGLEAIGRARPEVLFDRLPDNPWHGRRYARMGPDGMLYVAVGSPCNVCRVTGLEGTIIRLNVLGGAPEVFAAGVRNSVGLDFHPATGELFFTDNGADMMGDDVPPDELNHAPRRGLHFGFPYYGGGSVRTADFLGRQPPGPVTMPAVRFGAHVAALGLHFYRGSQFPPAYRNDAFVAQHGSWNRTVPDGYRVARVRFNGRGRAVSWQPFAEGWLREGTAWGRPVDVTELWDGSLLVSDDRAGAVYRITYRTP